MKKILLALKNLEIGGIERSAVTLIKNLQEMGYMPTLVLEKKKGTLLKSIDSKIQIIQYTPSENRFKPVRKVINLMKRIKFIFKYKNKFDASISFATYSKTCSFIARTASKNSILWCHADYLALFNGNKEKMEDFFYQIYYDKFNKIVFVAEKAKETFLEVFPNIKNIYVCNNLIDDIDIFRKSKKEIKIKYNPEITTFLNVSRHDEVQKKITRILKAAIKLKKDGYKFRIILIGNGQATKIYKKITAKYNLQNEVIFIGEKNNPYPYYKISNCVLLSSDYEGYPVVFLESFLLNKPIITTDVSDYKDVQNGRGIVVKKDSNEFYKAMKNFIENGYEVKNKFDVISYNINIQNKLKNILNSKGVKE